MISLTASQIAAALGGELTTALPPKTPVPGPVVIDSRRVEPGALFVALPGTRHDGHEFLSNAFTAGAAAAIVTQDTNFPAIKVSDGQQALGQLARFVLQNLPHTRVIALTGSTGKTTTKDLISQIISPQAPTIAPVGSFNNEIGLPLTVLRATAETKYLVLEMGAAGIGHLEYLTNIAAPDIAIQLGVGQAHLGEFGSIERVAQAKSELITGTKPAGSIILNCDDFRVRAMAAQAGGRTVRYFGSDSAADVHYGDIAINSAGAASFTLTSAGETRRIDLQIIGEHQVINATAAAALALELGIELDAVAQRLSSARALSSGRMEVTKRPDDITIIHDAYNANPESMAAALQTLARIAAGKRTWAVLGEMRELGPAATTAHERVGQLAVQNKIARVIAIGEEASGIISAGRSAGAAPQDYRFVPDIASARTLLNKELQPEDVVLLKASNGTGLWRLGDELAKAQEED